MRVLHLFLCLLIKMALNHSNQSYYEPIQFNIIQRNILIGREIRAFMIVSHYVFKHSLTSSVVTARPS